MKSFLQDKKILVTALSILFCGAVVAGVLLYVGQPSTAEATHTAEHCPGLTEQGQAACEADGCYWRSLGTNPDTGQPVGVCQNPATGNAGSGQGVNTTYSPPTRASACNFWDVPCQFFQFVSYTALTLSGFALWLAGTFFDIVITVTVENMADFINGVAGIEIAWRVLRDIVNMAFIFALLYIAIATILRIEEYGAKRLLSRLIIIALLINFSLFFTKVVIDASNVLTAEFTNGIKTLSGEIDLINEGDLDTDNRKLDSISGAFVKPLQLTTLYGATGYGQTPVKLDAQRIAHIGIYGSIFLLIAAFIFFAGAILLAIRFVMFIFLLVSSPIAFAGMILPLTRSYAQKWWTELFKYAIFAPVYMALLLAVAVIVTDPEFQTSLAGGNVDFLSGGFIGFLTGEGGGIVVLLNFSVVSGLMIAALVSAQQMGVKGAQALANLGSTIGLAPFKGAQAGLGHLAHIVDRKLAEQRQEGTTRFRRGLGYLSPSAWKRAWKMRQEDLDKDSYAIAPSDVADTMYRYIRNPDKWKKPSPKDFGLRARQGEILRGAREILELKMSESEMVEKMLNAEGILDRQKYGMAINALNRQDDFSRILYEMKEKNNGTLKGVVNMKQDIEYYDPESGEMTRKKLDNLVDGVITPETFQEIFYGSYLGEMDESAKTAYANMMQEFGEANRRLYHFGDTFEVTEQDGSKRRVVNYGYSNLEGEILELEEKQASGQELTEQEKQRLARTKEYYGNLEGEYKGRLSRGGAKEVFNNARAADWKPQFANNDVAIRESVDAQGRALLDKDGRPVFDGESYGAISHGIGKIITRHSGVAAATQMRNRKHEVQERLLVGFGARGEDWATDLASSMRAASHALENPSLVETILDEKDTPVAEKAETIVRVLERAVQMNEEYNMHARQEKLQKIQELLKKWQDKLEGNRGEAGESENQTE